MSVLGQARILFWSIVASVGIELGVGLALSANEGSASGWVPVAIGGVGVLAILGVRWFRRLPLRRTDERTLAGAFLGRVIVAAALAEQPAILGLVGSLVTGDPWPVVVGALTAWAALSFAAPTDAEVDRRQQEIIGAGSSISLRAALDADTRFDAGGTT